MVYIYILKLQHDKYYVGKTNNPDFRLDQHFHAGGSAWTKLHKPISIDKIYADCDDFDEDKYTKIYMSNYGIDDVRGGSYCQVTLDDASVEVLNKELLGASDVCYNCGRTGHFINSCPDKKNKKIMCDKCGRYGHISNDCYAKTHADGHQLNDKSVKDKPVKDKLDKPIKDKLDKPIKDKLDKKIICYRCGRKGHVVTDCYAKTHVDGNQLKDISNKSADENSNCIIS